MAFVQDEAAFAREFEFEEFKVCSLWRPDGSEESLIIIEKEVWAATDPKKVDADKDSNGRYKVFFVYNFLDPSKAYSKSCGCRVNKVPLYDFQEALKIARQHEAEALKSGQWLTLEMLKARKSDKAAPLAQ